MSEQTQQLTDEQIDQIKKANAHGFIDCLTALGRPKVENGQIVKSASGDTVRVACTTEEAVKLFEKAAKFNADYGQKVLAQIEPVKQIVREHLGGATSAAAA